jgi:hypothetical protein
MSEWGWPQWFYAIMLGLNFFAICALHGKPRFGTFNAAHAAIGGAITIWVLTAGGFF